LSERSSSGARNVLRAIEEAIEAIERQPHASQRAELFNIRVKVVRRYPYRIFYRVLDEHIVEIAHVRHTARRPWSVH